MRISSFTYLVKEGVKNVWLNRLMSFASIGVLCACLLLVGASVLFSYNVNQMVGFVEKQNQVILFINDNTSEADISEMDQALTDMPNITAHTFVSKDEGLELVKKDYLKDKEYLVEDYQGEANFLPDSFHVTLTDLSMIDETLAQLYALPNVDQIEAPNEMAATITSIKNVVYLFGIIIVCVLVVVSIVVIANTIKITVYSRRKEINIMKFVGATDSFIRLPFVVEGILLGLISAALAFFALWGGYNYLSDFLASSSSTFISMLLQNVVPFSLLYPYVLAGFLGAGVITGMFGSTMFVRKYLKV